MKLTDKEFTALHKLRNSEYRDSDNPWSAVWTFEVCDSHSEAGVLSSLLKKGLVALSTCDKDDDCVEFTKLGFEVYSQHLIVKEPAMKTTKLEKKANEIVKNLEDGLKGAELDQAVRGLGDWDEKTFDAIVNAYRQRDVNDLVGDAAPKAEPTPKKKAAKKVVAKKAAKKVAKKAVKKVAKKAASDAKPFPKPEGRTERMFVHVLAGKSNAAALALIMKEFPGAPTNISSIGWVRSQLRNNAERWDGKYGVTLTKARTVKADKDCK